MPKKGKAQIWLEFAIARSIFGFLSLLPRKSSVAIGVTIGRLGFRLLGRLRKVALANLSIAFPEKSEQEKAEIAKGTFENLGRVLGEASHFRNMTPERVRGMMDFDLDPELDKLYRSVKTEKRGVLITTAHMGNWELLVLGFAALYEPISYLARPLDNPLIEEMTLKIRTQFGNRPINKTNSVMTAISILKRGGILGILADVNAHPRVGVFVRFFGVPACTTTGAAMMAIRADALILPAFCVWDKNTGRYKFVHGKLIEPPKTGDRDEDIRITTEMFTLEIENAIRAYPDQWLWIHRRWKTRPPGENEVYQ